MVALLAGAVAAAALFVWPHAGDGPRPIAAPPCSQGPTVPGIDVSYYQQDIAWKRVRKAGIRFAFVRVADGSTIVDARFRENWAGARRAGVLRGAYQYFRPEQSATEQADVVIRMLSKDPGELPPVIDVESSGGKTPAQVAEAVRAWVDRVRDKLGVEPIVYTGPDFWRHRVGGADFTRQPLWIAHYTTTCPTVPPQWTRWTFWQHTDNGRVSGIDGPVDFDVFAGTVAELQAFARERGPRRR